MVIVSILPHAEFGPNDNREDAPHFIQTDPNNPNSKIDPVPVSISDWSRLKNFHFFENFLPKLKKIEILFKSRSQSFKSLNQA